MTKFNLDERIDKIAHPIDSPAQRAEIKQICADFLDACMPERKKDYVREVYMEYSNMTGGFRRRVRDGRVGFNAALDQIQRNKQEYLK